MGPGAAAGGQCWAEASSGAESGGADHCCVLQGPDRAPGGKEVAAGGRVKGGGADCAPRAEGKNAWQDEGARGDEDRREDRRRSAEVGGAPGGDRRRVQGEEWRMKGLGSAREARTEPTCPQLLKSMSVCLCVGVCLFVRARTCCHWRTGRAVTSGPLDGLRGARGDNWTTGRTAGRPGRRPGCRRHGYTCTAAATSGVRPDRRPGRRRDTWR